MDTQTNRITLDRTVQWTDGQGITLAYSGAAPDIGVYEYGSEDPDGGPPSPDGGITDSGIADAGHQTPNSSDATSTGDGRSGCNCNNQSKSDTATWWFLAMFLFLAMVTRRFRNGSNRIN